MSENGYSMSDEQVVGSALVNKEAFGELVKRYEARLTRYLHRLGVYRQEDTEDVLQNIFLKTYRNLNEFDKSLKFSSWIYRIAHNEAMSFFRARSVRPEGSIIDDSESALEILRSNLDASHEAERNIDAEHLSKALASIDAKYRDVIVLRYFEEREYTEISDILRIPTGTVATLLNRAKKKLQKELSHLTQV
ncbi:sigma-70 family RNA polymerase sigma factor [Candidatus Uhrbacteria bacterium]|nr:sigma-70 family RNA polymerase sigma factor [Candidatus Uhrbacteria bacterium]